MTVSTAASVSGRQRGAAAVALLAAVLTFGFAIVLAFTDFLQGVGGLGCVAVALVAAWFGVVRGGRQGVTHPSAATIPVSNNPYRLGRAVGSGTRPRIDSGQLGVAVVRARGEDGAPGTISSVLRQWSTFSFQVDSTHPVPLGIDGEAVVLEPPIRFRIRPGVLRVRIAPQHPGTSPSAMQPDRAGDGFRVLAAIASGRGPTTDALRRRDVQADI